MPRGPDRWRQRVPDRLDGPLVGSGHWPGCYEESSGVCEGGGRFHPYDVVVTTMDGNPSSVVSSVVVVVVREKETLLETVRRIQPPTTMAVGMGSIMLRHGDDGGGLISISTVPIRTPFTNADHEYVSYFLTSRPTILWMYTWSLEPRVRVPLWWNA